ncbi:MAG: Asp-tRNA(Asn)/Glu-tRNA(Gln) amidotransferase GatCAB subunit B, partial [Gammaproteobacteria bacterium]|nr:Asp-tRNA(Asn)/Glu-tRNA(Gln) amidotransferase GatCAB subunit B [Gammaproteobacteria bacterium]
NSFRFIEKAINYEVERQIDVLEDGGTVIQETRLYDADLDETRSMRGKEEANDYRYFPDPDLLPVELNDEYVESIRSTLPELPDAKKVRFMSEYGLSGNDASILTINRETADYYEDLVRSVGGEPRLCANWTMMDLSGALNRENLAITESPVSPELLGGMLKRIADKTISGKIGKQIFDAMWNGEGDADTIIEAKGLKQVTDSGAIERLVDGVITANPNQLEQYRAGKEKLLGFFVGQVMKASRGKANPQQVNELLRNKLKG